MDDGPATIVIHAFLQSAHMSEVRILTSEVKNIPVQFLYLSPSVYLWLHECSGGKSQSTLTQVLNPKK